MKKSGGEPSRPEKLELSHKSAGATKGSDPLADSLMFLAAYHGRAVTREALLGGLPITDGRLNVALYDRAARRAGLETEAVKRELSDIPALVLPAVSVAVVVIDRTPSASVVVVRLNVPPVAGPLAT